MNSMASQSIRRRDAGARPRRWALGVVLVTMAGVLAGTSFAQEKAGSPPVQVTIKDDKAVVVEPVLPVDPVRRINYQPTGLAVAVRSENNQTLHLGHYPMLNVDGALSQNNLGGRVEFDNRPLPKGKGLKDREGFSSCYVYGDGIRVTATITVEPTKPLDKAAKRRRDAVLIHYVIENQGKKPHKVGLKIYMDTYIIDNDGCLFAAPTFPGKILDGVVLKDKQLPPYVQLLQRPDLKNPGYVAHLTLDLGSKLEKPDRVVLTRHGAGGFGGWDMPAMMAGGDSALGIFWEPKEIKPGGKREFAYGYGQGIVTSPENEGAVEVALGGSFEPGKLFSVTAYVSDPAPGQSLTLELPEGMALAEGKDQQPVPELRDGSPYSVVFWRARVLRPGQFGLRVRSSTGVTHGKIITISQAKG
jgi:hypothetical protein